MEADCDTVPTGLALQLQPVKAVAHDQSIHEFMAELEKEMQHCQMFSYWRIDLVNLLWVLFQQPALCVSEATLAQRVRDKIS